MTDGKLLDGRVAIVTGGARGIGEAISRMLVNNGASVVVADSGVDPSGNDPDPSLAQAFAGKLGDAAVPYVEDMGIQAAAKGAVDLAVEQFGGIDIVINNAAILRDAFIFKGSANDWDAVIRNNLSAAYYLLAAATPVMREQAKAGRGVTEGADENTVYSWGRILNLVSTAAYYGNYGQASYASAKGGLTSLMRIAALDMARSAVTSNAVVPFAHTRVTEMIEPANDEQAAYKERGLKIDPSHVANMIAWLCSPAAAHISGQIFGVRGREVFLFSQPRPIARVISEDGAWTPEALAVAADGAFPEHYAELMTDLEAFNTEPMI